MKINIWNINSNYSERCVIAKQLFNELCESKGEELALYILHDEDKFNELLDLYVYERETN